ncbi:hypothetical protein WJX72_010285 [[Myrmecia] bisecta]|uniref:Uncharacterized protein n=1 Tax=[Myrmecia] bisecta TaxID=41462 RepID=A0AAW1QT85_9CHLO
MGVLEVYTNGPIAWWGLKLRPEAGGALLQNEMQEALAEMFKALQLETKPATLALPVIGLMMVVWGPSLRVNIESGRICLILADLLKQRLRIAHRHRMQDSVGWDHLLRPLVRMAAHKEAQRAIEHVGGIDTLLRCLKHMTGRPPQTAAVADERTGGGSRAEHAEDAVALMLWTLLNVSKRPRAQAEMGRQGLNTLLAIVHRPHSPQHAATAAVILQNIRAHPDNVTRFYKAELALKKQALLASAGLDTARLPRPQPSPRLARLRVPDNNDTPGTPATATFTTAVIDAADLADARDAFLQWMLDGDAQVRAVTPGARYSLGSGLTTPRTPRAPRRRGGRLLTARERLEIEAVSAHKQLSAEMDAYQTAMAQKGAFLRHWTWRRFNKPTVRELLLVAGC